MCESGSRQVCMVAGPLVYFSRWLSDFHEETAEGSFLVALPCSHPDQ